MTRSSTSDRHTIGLCASCRHAQRVTSAKASTFWRCGRSDTDPRFPRYPRLPVLECPGFERRAEAPSD